jgi:hypothetical protein
MLENGVFLDSLALRKGGNRKDIDSVGWIPKLDVVGSNPIARLKS